MSRLVINPGTPQAWEIQLRPGSQLLGRRPDCDVPISDRSISGSHCRITIEGETVLLQDLGSTNGTFVDGARVEEARIQPGQSIRLGNVEMVYQTAAVEAPAVAEAPPLAPPIPASTSSTKRFCKFHPRSLARFACPKCGRGFCEVCVNVRQDHGKSLRFCRACSVPCVALDIPAEPEPQSKLTYNRAIFGAFVYPFKGDGIILLVSGGVFFMLIDAARYLSRFAGLYGLVAVMLLTVFGTGYLVVYLRSILTETAGGAEKMPDWPDLNDITSDLTEPFLQLLGTIVFSFGPAIILYASLIARSSWVAPWMLMAAILVGCAYFPMAFTAVAMFDSVGGVNPLLVVPSILKIPWAYLLTVVVFAAALFARWLGREYLPSILPAPILGWIIMGFFSLYLLFVETRILGLLYRYKKFELGWFQR